ncbi:zinc/manganese transport system substrate-binding protein [Spinactinospora alkalitolerans]|uniref:Zinc/manganese transport system substrate-binding protein n=1 Tax=Spinactinospora alkalitolerans TaxID=687207 RepID=A0A852U580_9ACTN|nr:zinc ABC transporter substrate-binding protein [Spinactinospora alkalitolerans]NYE50767.1 zinc/manganese transport system substrate-binding protein [Spinactinospora alkalitolerans]
MFERAKKVTAPLAGLVVPLLAVSACGGADEAAPADGGGLRVVASTNVWGDVVRAVGGDAVEVTSIIDDVNVDPHSYESSPAEAAEVADADLVIYNGGGYDAFMENLVANTDAPVIQAVRTAEDGAEEGEERPAPAQGGEEEHAGHEDGAEGGDHAHDGEEHGDEAGHGEEHGDEAGHGDEGGDPHAGHDHSGNEHIWYDVHAVHDVAEAVSAELGELVPDQAEAIDGRAQDLGSELEGIEERIAAVSEAHSGDEVLSFDPIPQYLLEEGGLDDLAPEEFLTALEAGNDPPASAVADVQDLIDEGEPRVVLHNPQTESGVTRQLRERAEGNGIPVVEISELVPADTDYATWMGGQVDALAEALES